MPQNIDSTDDVLQRWRRVHGLIVTVTVSICTRIAPVTAFALMLVNHMKTSSRGNVLSLFRSALMPLPFTFKMFCLHFKVVNNVLGNSPYSLAKSIFFSPKDRVDHCNFLFQR